MSKKKNGYIKRMSNTMYKLKRLVQANAKLTVFIVFFGIAGAISLLITRAGAPSAAGELENATVDSCTSIVNDTSASNGKAIQLGSSNCAQTASFGAKLPINYSLSSLAGTIRYVALNGSDASSNPGTSVSAPLATLARALALTNSANSTIVVRGGVYRNQSNIEISGSNKNGLKIIAYPGETPVFNGAQTVSSSSGWTNEGTLQYRAYQPRPLADGGGVAFSSLSSVTNLNGDGVGRYPDQAWIGTTALRQVIDKSQVQDGRFFVDSANNRIYMTSTDVAKGNIETSQPAIAPNEARNRAIRIYGATNVVIEGISFTRYSPNANDYGVITVDASTNGATFRNVEISQTPYDGITFSPIDNPKIDHMTISDAGWKGMSANQTDNLMLDSVKITNVDPFDEFKGSPVSGALKTSRTRGTVVKNSLISSNKSHGLWFDQSNINVTVANNIITGNTGVGVFFEISDGLLLVNNYIQAPSGGQAVKMAGSSGLKLVNNTLIGGVDPVGIYTDSRSSPGCAANVSNCLPGLQVVGGERQGRFAPGVTMDWMPRLDLMLNNIVAYPSGAGLCASTAMCITTYHSIGASAPLNTIIHKADTTRGIPQTQINGNVYANGSLSIIRVSVPAASYTTLADFIAAMAASPVSITGFETNGKYGNTWVNTDGSPTGALSAAHSQAAAIPADGNINQYIPAGTRHYGVTYK